MQDIREIDWNEILKKIRAGKDPARRNNQAAYWNKRAPSFADHAGKTHYPDSFLRILNPEPSWTVLDMGCGGGTLALPLAERVAQVTAGIGTHDVAIASRSLIVNDARDAIEKLIRAARKWTLDYRHVYQWAVFHWNKEILTFCRAPSGAWATEPPPIPK